MATWIPSAEAFGTPGVLLGVGVSSVASQEAFGTATVINTSVTLVFPASVLSAQAVGTPTQAYLLAPPGVVSETQVAAPSLKTAVVVLLSSATARGHGRLTIPLVLGAGVVTGSADLSGTSVFVYYASAHAEGQGDLVWNGPLPAQGRGTLQGSPEVVRYPRYTAPSVARSPWWP